jgi:tRNA uridine 5-carboxymethylaminomethyl modification enzyme
MFCKKQEAVSRETSRISAIWVSPKNITAQESEVVFGHVLPHEYSLVDLLKRPEISYDALMQALDGRWKSQDEEESFIQDQINEQVEIRIKYQGYINRQAIEIERHAYYENLDLPDEIDYQQVTGLSNEVEQKLSAFRPKTLGQASRMSGVTPAAISLLLVHLKRGVGRKSPSL